MLMFDVCFQFFKGINNMVMMCILEGHEQYGYVIIFWKGINCDVCCCN